MVGDVSWMVLLGVIEMVVVIVIVAVESRSASTTASHLFWLLGAGHLVLELGLELSNLVSDVKRFIMTSTVCGWSIIPRRST